MNNTLDNTLPLRFGIPSLDELIGGETKTANTPYEDLGVKVGDGTSSICIMGPDGAGKSILGLHLASRYAADSGLLPGNRAALQLSASPGGLQTNGTPASAPTLAPNPTDPPQTAGQAEQQHVEGQEEAAATSSQANTVSNAQHEDPNGKPFVFYVSTDLLHPKAKRIWELFALNKPNSRTIPHTFCEDGKPYGVETRSDAELKLEDVLPPEHESVPDKSEGIETFLKKPEGVGFLDLAAQTAGDDWAYVNRLLAILPKREPGQPKHLMVIDAIEGLEVMAGEHDAFGERRTRRSRIAQLVRSAAGKCHLAFIVEEMKDGERLAEEFVADLVIRLRVQAKGGTVQRTLEVIKSRAQAHRREPHDYEIRSGQATLTGNTDNPDESENKWDEPENEGDKKKFIAYVHVHHGVNTLFANIAKLTDPVELPDVPMPTFGIRYLDAMLGHDIERSPGQQGEPKMSKQSNVTALIGDVATYKTSLGHAFLSECFSRQQSFFGWPEDVNPEHPDEDKRPVAVLLTTQLTDAATLAQRLFVHLPRGEQETRRQEAIAAFSKKSAPHGQEKLWSGFHKYLTRGDKIRLRRYVKSQEDKEDKAPILSPEILERAARGVLEVQNQIHNTTAPSTPLTSEQVQLIAGNLAAALMEDRIICRRLPVRDLTSAQFFHIVESAVRAAREKIGAFVQTKEARWQGQPSLRAIRLVIDDWSTLRTIYPAVAGDSLLLQFLIQYLQWQQVTALIVDTQPGDPETIRSGAGGRDLRALTARHVYTWHVPFFKEDRVAIAVIPPPPPGYDLRASVRELRPRPAAPGKLAVDPHFENYYGLEKGEPHPLPLRVLLYTGSSGAEEYVTETDALLHRFFSGVDGGPIVLYKDSTNYEALRQMANTPRGTRLECTEIIQVDEFWKHAEDQVKPGAARSTFPSEGATFCRAYLNARTVNDDGKPTPEDPFQLFQPSEATSKANATDRRRHSFFNLYELDYCTQDQALGKSGAMDKDVTEHDAVKQGSQPLDANLPVSHRVPMTWDFGFLLCRRRSWRSAEEIELQTPLKKHHPETSDRQAKKVTVKDVWDRLTKPKARQLPVSWFEFFLACRAVAQTQLRHGVAEPVFAFDVDLHGPSSLSCLVLEVWASELWKICRTEDTPMEAAKKSEAEKEDWKKQKKELKKKLQRWFPHQRTDHQLEGDTNLFELSEDPDGQWALFRALLLVFGVTEPGQFAAGYFQQPERGAERSAVAARHWYSTASRSMADWDPVDPTVPVRLPGHYSVRGDWFLTIADGSQSPQLAKSALDLLSSSRSNIARMQQGVGLPTRHIQGLEHQSTRLFTVDVESRIKLKQDTSKVRGNLDTTAERPRYKRWMRYHEVCQLGAIKDEDGVKGEDLAEFQWLWRSRFSYFSRHARIWTQWLLNMMQSWHRRSLTPEYQDLDAFELYEFQEGAHGLVEIRSQLERETRGSYEPDYNAANKNPLNNPVESKKAERWFSPETVEKACARRLLPDETPPRTSVNSEQWVVDLLFWAQDKEKPELHRWRRLFSAINFFDHMVEHLIEDLKEATPYNRDREDAPSAQPVLFDAPRSDNALAPQAD